MSSAEDLSKAELFADLDERDLERLARTVVAREYKAGDVILREGEPGVAFYILRKGQVSVVKEIDTPEELLLFTLGPGDVFGEMDLLLNDVRSESVRADEDCECLVLTKWDFEAELAAPDSRVANQLLPILARRIKDLEGQMRQSAVKVALSRSAAIVGRARDAITDIASGGKDDSTE